MDSVLFTNIRPHDLLVVDGRIADPSTRPENTVIVDGGGALALPAPVDAHIHPDKTTWGHTWLSRTPASTLRELIEGEVKARAGMTASVAERAGALMDSAVARGTRAWRAHVDVAPSTAWPTCTACGRPPRPAGTCSTCRSSPSPSWACSPAQEPPS
ncbi:hypothetical protein ACFQGX_29565 [Nonomuraea dietziae]|uniref:hypothetical protein n=1 Tax=Nonomuraea dietziae TaxID=65515 RepID=UPI003616B807